MFSATRIKQRFGILHLTAAIAAGLASSTATAQIVVTSGETTDQPNAFVVRKESKLTLDALEDFERFRDKRAWEKAFGALEKVATTDPGRMVAAADGFYVPTTERILTELLSLPPDGRQAYRLFNDAHAKQLLDQAAAQPDEVPALRSVVGRYFITSVGDKAADRLGDALFERGDFPAAERSWRLIVDSFPDTSLSIPQVQVKRVIALTRAGDSKAAEALAATLDPSVTIRLGGKDVKIADAIGSLHSAGPAAGPAAPVLAEFVSVVPAFGKPVTSGPVWQIPLADAEAFSQFKSMFSNNGWGNIGPQMSQTLPTTAVDEKRIYINFAGICCAADLRTGKVLWTTDALGDTLTRLRNFAQMGRWYSPGSFQTVVIGDRVYFSSTSVQNNSGTALSCLDGATGQVIWRSDQAALRNFNITGRPLIDRNDILVLGRGSGSDVFALSIDAKTGNLRWATSLGQFTSTADMRGFTTEPTPVLLHRGDKLDVMTNNGATLELDLGSHNVEWACTYPTIPPPPPYYYYNAPTPPPVAQGSILADATTLYVKERGNDTLYAIDPAKRELKWKRPVDSTNGLAGIANGRLLLTGSSVQSIDLESRELLWNAGLVAAANDCRYVLANGWLYAADANGIQGVDTSTGASTSLKANAGADIPNGGDLWKTADRLITVTPTTVTAFAVVPPGGK
jgi:outer membrane protein assembly factor BamB